MFKKFLGNFTLNWKICRVSKLISWMFESKNFRNIKSRLSRNHRDILKKLFKKLDKILQKKIEEQLQEIRKMFVNFKEKF